jgi:hypothetical protein
MASNGNLRLVVIDSDPAVSAFVKKWVNGRVCGWWAKRRTPQPACA